MTTRYIADHDYGDEDDETRLAPLLRNPELHARYLWRRGYRVSRAPDAEIRDAGILRDGTQESFHVGAEQALEVRMVADVRLSDRDVFRCSPLIDDIVYELP